MRTGLRTNARRVLLAAALLAAGHVFAATGRWDPARALAGAGWSWSGAQEFELAGARLRVTRFHAQVAPARAARRLSETGGGRFDRLVIAESGLVLSGLWRGRHWLAQLKADRAGTTGLVSSLSPVMSRAAGFDATRFAPAGAHQVLQVSSRSPATHGALASFDCPGTLAGVADTVYRTLRAARWQAVAPAESADAALIGAGARPATPGAALLTDWRNPEGDLLTLHLVARTQTVALTFWYRPGAAS